MRVRVRGACVRSGLYPSHVLGASQTGNMSHYCKYNGCFPSLKLGGGNRGVSAPTNNIEHRWRFCTRMLDGWYDASGRGITIEQRVNEWCTKRPVRKNGKPVMVFPEVQMCRNHLEDGSLEEPYTIDSPGRVVLKPTAMPRRVGANAAATAAVKRTAADADVQKRSESGARATRRKTYSSPPKKLMSLQQRLDAAEPKILEAANDGLECALDAERITNTGLHARLKRMTEARRAEREARQQLMAHASELKAQVSSARELTRRLCAPCRAHTRSQGLLLWHLPRFCISLLLLTPFYLFSCSGGPPGGPLGGPEDVHLADHARAGEREQ